jgi:hypothetical protein
MITKKKPGQRPGPKEVAGSMSNESAHELKALPVVMKGGRRTGGSARSARSSPGPVGALPPPCTAPACQRSRSPPVALLKDRLKTTAAPKGGHMSYRFRYQRKIVILWMYAVIEPLPELAPSNWKLMSRSPRAQPRLSAELPVAFLKALWVPSTFT